MGLTGSSDETDLVGERFTGIWSRGVKDPRSYPQSQTLWFMPLAAHFAGKDGKLLRIFFTVAPSCSSGNQQDSFRLTACGSRHSLSLVLSAYRHLWCLSALPLWLWLELSANRSWTNGHKLRMGDRCPPVRWGSLTLTMVTRGHYWRTSALALLLYCTSLFLSKPSVDDDSRKLVHVPFASLVGCRHTWSLCRMFRIMKQLSYVAMRVETVCFDTRMLPWSMCRFTPLFLLFVWYQYSQSLGNRELRLFFV